MIKIGHRGAGGYEVENTLPSFKKALELNVDYVEFDVSLCKTGEIIVYHDTKVDRTTSGKGFVCDKTFDEICALDAGKGNRIPTLHEVLDLVNRKIKVNIELKGEGSAEPVYKTIEKYVLENGWEYDDFLISSFNHYELLRFRELSSDYKIGAVIACIPIGYAKFATELNAYSVHLSKEFINQNFIDDIHNRGLKAFVYTVNEPYEIEKMRSMKVDGIFSDFPDRI